MTSRRSERNAGGDVGVSKELPNIFFCGDPHGEFAHINEAARLYKPDAMVILGDSQPSAPLEELLGEAMSLTDIWWIPGNHDTDTDEYFDYLWRGPLASHNLHGRVTTVRRSFRPSTTISCTRRRTF